MGLFDWYRPVPALTCPRCGEVLDGWQGHDGLCGLFVWRQGHASPVDQLVDDEIKCPAEQRRRKRLPARFLIHTGCCDSRFLTQAVCVAVDRIWVRSRLMVASDVD